MIRGMRSISAFSMWKFIYMLAVPGSPKAPSGGLRPYIS